MKPVSTDPHIRILKTSSCPSLSDKSTLTYHIGLDDKSEILIRVSENNGGGYFSKEWVSLNAIRHVLEKDPSDMPFTSLALRSIFQGKSTNTPAFLMAVLKSEGLVNSVEDKLKQFELMSFDAFTAEIKKLMDSAVDPEKTSEPADGKAKRGRKPKSISDTNRLDQGS